MSELHAPSVHVVLPEGHVAAHNPLLQTPVDPHAVQLLPQWERFEETHAPPHKTRPDEHTHEPAWQVVPVPQTVPQAPQFWLSVARTTQAVPQAIWPRTHPTTGEPVSGAPPSAVGPAPDPEAQLATTASVQKRTEARARREKRW